MKSARAPYAPAFCTQAVHQPSALTAPRCARLRRASNARRAGVLDALELRCAAVSDLRAPRHEREVALVTNPPHGDRVSPGRDLVGLHGRLGAVARRRLPGWRIAVLTASLHCQTALRIEVERVLALGQGGRRVRLVVGRA